MRPVAFHAGTENPGSVPASADAAGAWRMLTAAGEALGLRESACGASNMYRATPHDFFGAPISHDAQRIENCVAAQAIGHRSYSVSRQKLSAPGVTACPLNPWLGADNRFGRLKPWGGVAWPSSLAATLALLSEKVCRCCLHVLVLPCAAFEPRASAWS